MSKISAMMDTGKRTMMNSQTALQTVGHNIANKATEGYSRQRVEVLSNEPIGSGNLRIGMGARAASITRTNNPYLEKQIQKEGAELGFTKSRSEGMARVEQVYNEQLNKGLNNYLSDFFNSFRELSNNPESLTSRTIVRESAEALTKDFKRIDDQLNQIQKDLDGQVIAHVQEVNQFTKEIAQLNEKIQQVEVQGVPANDERDRRDLLLKKLNEKMNISWAEGDNGMVTVTAGNTGVIVSGLDNVELKTSKLPESDKVAIFYSATENGTLSDITRQIKGGSIGGALEVRDQQIDGLIENIDTVAYTLAKEVNRAHIEGFDLSGKNGVLFFDMPSDVKGAAGMMKLNQTIANDANRIVSGLKQNAPADNTIANVISSLQYKQIMGNGSTTIDDFYSSQVGQVGVIAQRSVKSHESQQNIVAQLSNIRESISGVSLDEETTKMIEFQKAFDASARLIRTADEMFDTVLSLKR